MNKHFVMGSVLLIIFAIPMMGMQQLLSVDKVELVKHCNDVYSVRCAVTNLLKPLLIRTQEDLIKLRKQEPLLITLTSDFKDQSLRSLNKIWSSHPLLKLISYIMVGVSGYGSKFIYDHDMHYPELKPFAITASLVPAAVGLFGSLILWEDSNAKERVKNFGILMNPVAIDPGQSKYLEIYFDPNEDNVSTIRLMINNAQTVEIGIPYPFNQDNS